MLCACDCQFIEWVTVFYDVWLFSISESGEMSFSYTLICEAYFFTTFIAFIVHLLKNLVGRRRQVKLWLKNTSDPLKYQQLDIQQQALKLTANRFMLSSDFQVIPPLHWCSFPIFIGEVTWSWQVQCFHMLYILVCMVAYDLQTQDFMQSLLQSLSPHR